MTETMTTDAPPAATPRDLIYITGGKGGAGKSMAASMIVDHYVGRGNNVLLLDADPVNADTYFLYGDRDGRPKSDLVRPIRTRIRAEDETGGVGTGALLEALDAAAAADERAVIVDAPAGDTELLSVAGSTIVEVAKAAGMRSVIVWVAPPADRAPINALKASWPEINGADLFILARNLTRDDFRMLNDDEAVRKIMSGENTHRWDIPKIAPRLIEHLRSKRQSWDVIATNAPIATRVEAQRLRRQTSSALTEIGL